MESIKSSFNVIFESPYWIGIFEREEDCGYSVAKHIFGKEPTAPEIYEFILKNANFIKYSKPTIGEQIKVKEKINPKRKQREAMKTSKEIGISTKAQQALQKELESNKIERKKVSKQRKEELERLKFELKQEKKKEKKKGH